MSESSNIEQLNMYSEVCVESFEEAVDFLKEKTFENQSKFCLVDIDGVLLSNPLLKLPVVSHFVSPTISQEDKSSFCSLISDVFVDNNIVVVTNRNDFERVFWNSDKVLRGVRDVCDVPIITSLNKQLPGLSKKKCDELVGSIVAYARAKEDLVIYLIEDESIVCPSRKDFANYISNCVGKELGIDIRVVNLVIRG